MASIAPSPASVSRIVVGGIDTHKDLHVAAVVDGAEVVLGTESFPTTRAGYRSIVRWMRSFGEVRRVGVEGTGSYGAGITRHLAQAGIEVLEVFRPDRIDRRLRGKSDDLDAINAARAALHERRTTTPKTKDGLVESLRVLRVTRSTAVKSRRAALQLLRNHIVRRPMSFATRCASSRGCSSSARWPRGGRTRPASGTRSVRRGSLRSLARRILELDDEVALLDELIEPLVRELGPQLLERPGIGVEVAGQLLVTAGDNPERMRSEAGFAMLCGGPVAGLVGQDPTSPAQPRWRSPGQLGAPHGHRQPAPDARADEGLRRSPDGRGAQQTRDHPVPQALPRP
jgi:transposase